MERVTARKYDNGEITIVWQPHLCIHSTICWKQETGLPLVFNPRLRPWIMPEGAATEAIILQVSKCPSGALSYISNTTAPAVADKPPVIVETIPNGPLLIKGDIHLRHHDRVSEARSNVTAFCRCGRSANKPFCDGSHTKHQFE